MIRKLFCICVVLLCAMACKAEFDARQKIIELMENNGMEKYLTAPVTVRALSSGVLSIADEGVFAIQHELLTPDMSADPNVVIDEKLTIIPSADKLVVITHGWLDKGEKDWPSRMAKAIHERTDPNEWVCASYDWKGGSAVITSVQAAEYARDIAGPRLAAAILKLDRPFKHIHLVGHSAGSWTINAAAKRIAEERPDTTFHLTFFDAYVPEKWNPDTLGHIFTNAAKQRFQYWGEQYYTKDITWKVTQHDLEYCHNVDISDIDPLFAEHEFPYRWYMATITGRYDRWDEKKQTVRIKGSDDIDYGYTRSLESGDDNWIKTKKLKMHNKAVKISK